MEGKPGDSLPNSKETAYLHFSAPLNEAACAEYLLNPKFLNIKKCLKRHLFSHCMHSAKTDTVEGWKCNLGSGSGQILLEEEGVGGEGGDLGGVDYLFSNYLAKID